MGYQNGATGKHPAGSRRRQHLGVFLAGRHTPGDFLVRRRSKLVGYDENPRSSLESGSLKRRHESDSLRGLVERRSLAAVVRRYRANSSVGYRPAAADSRTYSGQLSFQNDTAFFSRGLIGDKPLLIHNRRRVLIFFVFGLGLPD